MRGKRRCMFCGTTGHVFKIRHPLIGGPCLFCLKCREEFLCLVSCLEGRDNDKM